MNYTKGEWKVYESPFAPAVVIEQGLNQRRIIATCRLERGSEGMAEAEANAHLISAAPDMYEAIKWSIEELERLAPSFGDMAWSIITVLNGAKLKAEAKEVKAE